MIDPLGVFEWHVNRNFSFAWASAKGNAKNPVQNRLKEDRAIVVCIYIQQLWSTRIQRT